MNDREQKIIKELEEANNELHLARLTVAEAKRRHTEAETRLIEIKLLIDKLTEKLSAYRSSLPVPGERYDLFDE